MKPDALLELANEMPSKFGVETYRDTICTLRRKGYTWREIADFVIEKGVKTDHTRIYRMMMEGDPLYDFDDAPLNIGGLLYESQKGHPLHSFGNGMVISLREKLQCILLEHPERVFSTWCQCQFRLSSPPNRNWLKKLHDELHAEFRPDWPHHLVSAMGYELKFEGDVMALDCHTFNLKQHFKEVQEAISQTTRHWANEKELWLALWKKNEVRKEKILDLYGRPYGETDGDILEGHAEDYADKATRLKKQFDKLELP